MAKAVGQILLVASSVALVATGVGAAAGLALFGTTAGISFAGVSLGAIALAGSLASALGGLLIGGPKAQTPEATVTTVKQAIPPRVYGGGRRRLFGSKILFETNSAGTTVDVYAFYDGPSVVEQIYLNDDKVTVSGNTVNALPDKKYQKGRVKVGFSGGSAIGAAFSTVIAALPGIWTSAHRGDGVTTGYLLKEAEAEKHLLTTYPQGDNVELSAVFRLGTFFDPRTGLKEWSENSVLHLMDYLVNKRGYDYNTHFVPTLQYWIDAANICDENVPLREGGTVKRYRSCVTYNGTALPKDVIGSFLETFDGWIAPRGDGALVVYSGKLYTPSVTLGSDEIINYNLPFGVESENRVDQLTVTYVSDQHDYATVDCTPWGDLDNPLRVEGFAPQVPSYVQARMLAKRLYSRTNEFNRGTIVTNLGGRIARGERFINLDITEGGITFFSGVVEIISVRRDFNAGGLSIEWIAVDENIDTWNPVTEQGEPAPVGDRIAPQPLGVPTIASAYTVFTSTTDEGTGARIRVEVATPAPRGDYSWYVRYRRVTDAAWNEQKYIDVGEGAVVLDTGLVPVNVELEVEVAYAQGDGRISDWSETFTVNSTTSDTPPDPAVTITLTNWSSTLDLITDFIPRASSYRWRFYKADGTTLVRTLITSSRAVSYTNEQAASDGAQRAYIVRVAGVNGAGAGTEASTSVISLPAPAVVTGVTASENPSPGNAEIVFTPVAGATGYSVAVSTTSGFDPLTQGFITEAVSNPAYKQNLAVATYYTKVAGYDAWTQRPDLLNYSTEATFTITATSGGSGGGGGGGGGGYCPDVDTLILMSNGEQKRAGDLAVGDIVWTQHEDTMEWGAFPIEGIEFVSDEPVWRVDIGSKSMRATAEHRIWVSGGWVTMGALGVPDGTAKVARITVAEAHTYISNGVLSHNAKQTGI